MRPSRVFVFVFVTALLSGCATPTASVVPVDSAGTSVVIQGSDTEVQMVANLAEAFTADHPEADMSVTGGGSAVGIAALINGVADIANSSRQMTEEEVALAAERDIDVQEFIVARDGLAVVTHPSNPMKELSLEQIGTIYDGTITNWKDVGGPDAPIVLYGRQSTSGTFGFFRDVVVKADYSRDMRQMEGTQAIVDAVVADKNGIGYVGVGYIKDQSANDTPTLNVLLVRSGESEGASPLDREAVLSGKYPIARAIYQYMPSLPAKDSLAHQFLLFEASEAGQALVEESGFYPMTVEDAAQNKVLFDAIQ